MNRRKILSYIIDILLITFFSVIIDKYLVLNGVDGYRNQLNSISLDRIANDLSLYDYIVSFGFFQQKIDQANILNTMITLIATTNLVIFIPYYLNHQTIGQIVTKLYIKPETNKLTTNNLLFRALVLYGYGVSIMSLIFMYILPNPYYFILMCALSLAQVIIITISLIRMLRGKKTIQDILSKTFIVSI